MAFSWNRLFTRTLDGILGRGVLAESDLEDLEGALLAVDTGPDIAAELAEEARAWVRRVGAGVRKEVVYEALAEGVIRRYEEAIAAASPRREPPAPPRVVVLVGANGTGKTTTLAKLARRETAGGGKVLLGACDTFRAAAAEQLEHWADRIGAAFVSGREGGEPAAVAFDALSAGRARGCDAVYLDTAGRLANKDGLLRELEKVIRVLAKSDPTAPHEVLLVLDAPTGLNGIRQVEGFAKALPLTGLVLTKLDGVGRGGFVLPAVRRFGVPVRWAGTGEGPEDVRPFEIRAFARALVGIDASIGADASAASA